MLGLLLVDRLIVLIVVLWWILFGLFVLAFALVLVCIVLIVWWFAFVCVVGLCSLCLLGSCILLRGVFVWFVSVF